MSPLPGRGSKAQAPGMWRELFKAVLSENSKINWLNVSCFEQNFAGICTTSIGI